MGDNMKLENSLTIFIFSLVSSMFLYLISGTSSINAVNIYGGIISAVLFAIAMVGLFATSILRKRSLSSVYYMLLFITALIILIFHILSWGISSLLQSYFALAALIGLLLSLLDFRHIIIIKEKIIQYYQNKFKNAQKEIEKLKNELQKQKEKTEEIQTRIKGKTQTITKLKNKTSQIAKSFNKSEKQINSLNTKIVQLNKRKSSSAKEKKKIAELKTEQQKFQRELARSKKEAKKESELKIKYSKTLLNIRKRKKEAEELLVISSDGKSVHKPKCIIVRNVPKENRKLMKNWKTAKKQGLKGCKLCKPHTKDTTVQNNHIQYKFVASKDSDKVHKASCLLVKNINRKEKIFFKNYKAALKKGYTSCRICNSGTE